MNQIYLTFLQAGQINKVSTSQFLRTFLRAIQFRKVLSQINRSSRPEMFCKKGVLRNLTKFTGVFL